MMCSSRNNFLPNAPFVGTNRILELLEQMPAAEFEVAHRSGLDIGEVTVLSLRLVTPSTTCGVTALPLQAKHNRVFSVQSQTLDAHKHHYSLCIASLCRGMGVQVAPSGTGSVIFQQLQTQGTGCKALRQRVALVSSRVIRAEEPTRCEIC